MYTTQETGVAHLSFDIEAITQWATVYHLPNWHNFAIFIFEIDVDVDAVI